MENGYDENLAENPFFRALQTTYEEVFRQAVSENWIICIPCLQSLDTYSISESNILTHLLVPSDELPDTHFMSLNNEEVTICDKLVRLKNYHNVPVLFTEVFYADHLRYEIFCLEQPLNQDISDTRINPRIYFLKTLTECIDLLALESTNESVIAKLDEIITQFLFLSNKDYFLKTVDQQITFTRNIYNRCLQIVLMDKKLASKAKLSRMFMENIRIAVESYVLHNIHSIVMKGLISNMTEQIGQFNKALRNLASIQLQDLTIENSVLDGIPKARNELSHFYNYTTVLGKLSCLKRSINLISCKRSNRLSIDELLPILVFLVVKSGMTTWVTELCFVREFNFSHSDHNQASESSFLVTTLEAIITFIESGMFFKSVYFGNNHLQLLKPDEKVGNACTLYICGRSKLFWRTNNTTLLRLFQHIYEDDLDSVKCELQCQEMQADAISLETNNDSTTTSPFCHPLCSCDRCERIRGNSANHATPINVNSTNESGYSALHVATCYGRLAIVDWLLNQGALPNGADFADSTPLHCATMHGYQNVVLLLMYANATIDRCDDDGNQPLHYACANGHTDCVKALLYFAEHAAVQLDVNATNKDGDTPLHLAVKYYHKEITEILLNYNASVSLRNKCGRNVFELTHSLGMRDMLSQKQAAVVNLMCVSSAAKSSFAHFADVDGTTRQFTEKPPLPKDKFGVQPTTAEALKNTEKLFGAVRQNDLQMVKYLLGFGIRSGVGSNIVHNAILPQSPSSYKCHPLCRCKNCVDETSINDEEFVDDFYEVDALSVNICNADGVTALHIACRYGCTEAIHFLLDTGAKVNVRTYKRLLTPLHVACMSNQLEAAKILLECNGCDVNACDWRSNTVLHYACTNGNIRLVKLLLQYKPDIEIRNDRGQTAINECEENLSYVIMRLLKSPNIVNNFELSS